MDNILKFSALSADGLHEQVVFSTRNGKFINRTDIIVRHTVFIGMFSLSTGTGGHCRPAAFVYQVQ